MGESGAGGRMDRRKARTRAALIGAGQELLAEGRVAVSIQQITELADVGFGSFYNHFASKDELFAAALRATLEAHDALIAQAGADVDDPAELFALGLRSTGRLQRSHPDLARVLLHQGTSLLLMEEGIAAHARRDIAAGVASGRFVVEDVELSFMAVGGALLGLVQHLEAHPDVDAGEASDRLAASLLRLLGVAADDAARIVALPLPSPLG